MKDVLRVDESALREVEVHSCPEKLLREHGHIKVIGVEAGKVAALKLLSQVLGQVFKGRFVLHVIICYARESRHLSRYWLAGVHQLVAPLLCSVGHNLYIRNLYNPVVYKVKPRCFQVEHNKGLC